MSGGREEVVGYWGSVDYRLDVDTGKPGGFLNVHAMSSYGTSVNSEAGALVPVNGAALFPAAAVDQPTIALMKLHVHPVSDAVAWCLRREDRRARSRQQRLRARLANPVPEPGPDVEYGGGDRAGIGVGRRARGGTPEQGMSKSRRPHEPPFHRTGPTD